MSVEHSGPGMVLRVGELFLKGKNRHLFEEALERNVRRALAGRDDVRVWREHGRIFVYGAADQELASRLEWVFGLASFSPAVFCEKRIEAITEQAVALAREHAAGAATFAIAARRSDKTFDHTSTDIGRVVGAAVAQATGLGVDLEQPDLKVGIEVGSSWTFLWVESHPGAGGLPVGTAGRVALLLSGGIDSPVAGHLLQKRGLELTAIYFHAFPYTGDGARDKVRELAGLLARRQASLRLFVVPFARLQELFRDGGQPSYLVLLYRRAMIRIAEQLARRERIKALATGESLGQVASQTLANLATVEDAATLPILRPLITYDKAETIALARRIGSYEISIRPHDDCCTLFVPRHPETKGLAAKARRIEEQLDWPALLDEAVAGTEMIDV